MNKRDFILSSVKNRIKKIDPKVRILLFGSRARKDATDNSDWDFLILTNLAVNRELKNRISDELFETELETDEVLSGVIQNTELWKQYSFTSFYQNVTSEGIEL